MTWRRKAVRAFMGEQSIRLQDPLHVEETQLRYAALEFASAEDTGTKAWGEKSAAGTAQPCRTYDMQQSARRTSPAEARKELQQKQACLCLALKCCYFMDEKLVEKVSAATEVPKADLQQMLVTLESQMSRKIKRRERCIRRRDTAFFYHRKYMLELPHLDEGTALEEKVRTQLGIQTECWKEKNRQLQEVTHRIAPSNRVIAELLGLSPRRVEYILKKAAENIDNNGGRWYSAEHENISSERKQQQEA